MSLADRLSHFLLQHHLTDVRMLVAVSGGIDSVVLAHLCAHTDCIFVHANFGLREEESMRDEEFVRTLAEKLGKPVLVRRFDTADQAKKRGISIQEAARDLRYAWFRELLADTGAKCVLLAHQANDNIETALMNFFRGTGLEGLTGIKELSPDGCFGRPFLQATRADIEQHAKEQDIHWVEDSSNQSNKYTRNFFRNEVLPLIRTAYPAAEANVLANIARFRQIHQLYHTQVEVQRKKLSVQKGEETWLPVKLLQKSWQPALIYELIKPFGFNEKQVASLSQLLEASSGRYIRNDSWQIVRHRAWLVIAPISAAAEIIVIDSGPSAVDFREGRLSVEIRENGSFSPGTDPGAVLLDAADIQFPLILRPWRAGDYFYPLGMRKKKKLARFFIDSKLSKPQKEKVWVLESNRRIVWVIGLRIDDRFRLTPATSQALALTWNQKLIG